MIFKSWSLGVRWGYNWGSNLNFAEFPEVTYLYIWLWHPGDWSCSGHTHSSPHTQYLSPSHRSEESWRLHWKTIKILSNSIQFYFPFRNIQRCMCVKKEFDIFYKFNFSFLYKKKKRPCEVSRKVDYLKNNVWSANEK